MLGTISEIILNKNNMDCELDSKLEELLKENADFKIKITAINITNRENMFRNIRFKDMTEKENEIEAIGRMQFKKFIQNPELGRSEGGKIFQWVKRYRNLSLVNYYRGMVYQHIGEGGEANDFFNYDKWIKMFDFTYILQKITDRNSASFDFISMTSLKTWKTLTTRYGVENQILSSPIEGLLGHHSRNI